MSSFKWVLDPMDLSGSQSRDAADKIAVANDKAAATQKVAVDQARGEILSLFPSAESNALSGFQGALDVLGQAAPAQIEAFQGGNVAAQDLLRAGLPLQQSAILGQNVDFSQLQSFQAPQQDLGFLQQQLPQFSNISQALGIAGVSNDPQRPPVPTVGAPLPTAGTPQQQAAMRQLISDNPFSQQNVLGGGQSGGLAGAFMGGTGRGGFNPRRP